MSKRRGDVVFLDELLDAIGVDAARWYLVSRGHDQTIELDVDLAKRDGQEPRLLRPVRARPDRQDPPQSARNAEPDTTRGRPAEVDVQRSARERSASSSSGFSSFPASSRRRRCAAPHAIPIYAIRVADDFHRFYHEHRVLESGEPGVPARALCATQTVIARSSISSESKLPSGCRIGT